MLLAALILHSQLIVGRVRITLRVLFSPSQGRHAVSRAAHAQYTAGQGRLRGKQSPPPCPGSAGSESRTRRRRRVWRDAPACFPALPFLISVGVKFHPVQAGRILPGVDIIRFRAGHPRRHGASHLRARQQRRTPAQCFAVGHRQQGHPQRLPAAGGKTGAGD